jgi:methylated-DNA-protein-cysteine methyltransferase related protein
MNELNSLPAARQTFFAAVWKIAREIPPGKVFTYGQIAALIPPPAGVAEEYYLAFRARWAGQAMADCPENVPWQRVINSQGKISPRRGAEMQANLLVAEGVVFDDRQRVDLARFGWRGPSREWLEANNLVVPHTLQDPLF